MLMPLPPCQATLMPLPIRLTPMLPCRHPDDCFAKIFDATLSIGFSLLTRFLMRLRRFRRHAFSPFIICRHIISPYI
jgi:hypothetical protein